MSASLFRLPILTSLALFAACADDIGDGPADTDDITDGDASPDTETPDSDAAEVADAVADSDADATDRDAPEPDVEDEPVDRPEAPPNDGIYGVVHGCYALEAFDGRRRVGFAAASADGSAFGFDAGDPSGAARFRMQPADLGTYLLYDATGHYLASENDSEGSGEVPVVNPVYPFPRLQTLRSEIEVGIDGYRSPAEWTLEVSTRDAGRFALRNEATGGYLQLDGIVGSSNDAAIITLIEADDCAVFPELPLDAIGRPEPRQWDDGDVYGFADIHSHLMTNTGFGGGGMFHGAPFHRLGVEHALPDCSATHGEEGRRDLIGYFYDGGSAFSVELALPILATGMTPDFNHNTDGYPTFTDWPNARERSTHQVQYYRWLERAWLSGLRLIVELGTGNNVLCEFITGIDAQQSLYDCNEMVGVDHQIEAVRAMERFVDAQSGGPGLGWFRVVESPSEARDVINSGRLAVILGIETSNLFDCVLTPEPGMEPCTEESVIATLDAYHERGVRVIFPVHKYDNAFAPGDGSSGIIELGNFINSGHFSNLVPDCPGGAGGFDGGDITFGGLNEPRDDYDAPAPNNLSGFGANPLRTLLPFVARLQEPPIPGNYCQNAGLTPLGEVLIRGMIERGMIVDIAHLPRRAALDALAILEEEQYPATSTHAQTYGDRLFDIGGISQAGFGGCASLEEPDTMGDYLRSRVDVLNEHGQYPAAGFAFDFNGFAGGRGPRFGDESGCAQPQPNPIDYPFRSYDGSVEFTQATLGDREVDFNTEGMLHIGLVAELIEDVRRDGMSDADLEPLFRSAEAYIRLWESAVTRGDADLSR